jgi:hypothetical protein
VAVSQGELCEAERAIVMPVFGPTQLAVGALEIAIPDLAAAGAVRLALAVAAGGLCRQLVADPAVLPTGIGTSPLQWAADPTSTALSWRESEVAG